MSQRPRCRVGRLLSYEAEVGFEGQTVTVTTLAMVRNKKFTRYEVMTLRCVERVRIDHEEVTMVRVMYLAT